MGVYIKYTSFLLHLLLLKSSAQSIQIQPGSHEFFVTEIVRVKRQAGYVYNKPSISFDLPSRVPTVSTQAPNVDRTQAQQMYYAYPAPAQAPASGDTVSIGYSSGTSASSTAVTAGTASSSSSAGGYNYTPQTSTSEGTQTAAISGSGQTTNKSGSYQTATSSGSAQTATTSGSAQTGTSIGSSGYGYNAPKSSGQSNLGSSVDVSTNAPQYLPPTASGGGNVNVGSISVNIPTGSGVTSSAQTGSAVVAPLSDQYLPPSGPTNTNTVSGPTVIPSVSIGIAPGTSAPAPVPSSDYLPPNRPSPPFSIPTSARPSAPVSPTSGYIPPVVNSGSLIAGTVSTPAATYLPPVF